MTEILITGAAGFIGSFLAERLVADGHTVVGVDNLFRGKLENVAHLGDTFTFEKLDILEDIPRLEQIFRNGVEVVYHYAAINGTEHFYDKPLDVVRVNSEGTMNLLKLSARHNIKKFIFASSSEVYSDPLYLPTNEQHPFLLGNLSNPRYTYAAGKVISEYYTKWYAEAFGFKYLILRLFNTYGPRMDSSKYGQVIPEFIRKMLLEPEFTIIAPGTQTRSFCYISDLIDFTVLAAMKVDNDVLNLGSEHEITMIELARVLHELAGRPFSYRLLSPRVGDPKRRLPDTSRARAMLGYQPKTDLRSGLKLTLDWYQNRLALPIGMG
ncbi:MAG: NAD-dependent epimerase/dehydratase family protein [Chloroflexi bacterium]|nr:NAD-dependent epimerase/dehydratase family protein [Chloroflexota bacterium]